MKCGAPRHPGPANRPGGADEYPVRAIGRDLALPLVRRHPGGPASSGGVAPDFTRDQTVFAFPGTRALYMAEKTPMDKDRKETKPNAFCTFCMGSYDPHRIGTHVRRCRARVDDANCLETGGNEHPDAFILMARVEGWAEAWICLEAWCQARFSDLDRFLRGLWFPEVGRQGRFFFPKRKFQRRTDDRKEWTLEWRLDRLLRVKDRFGYGIAGGHSEVAVNLEVAGRAPTAFGHCSVDVAAIPLGSVGGPSPEGRPATIGRPPNPQWPAENWESTLLQSPVRCWYGTEWGGRSDVGAGGGTRRKPDAAVRGPIRFPSPLRQAPPILGSGRPDPRRDRSPCRATPKR